ncbi:DUF7521 family protein [Salinirubrum litoreum]|uniref:Uncharacterized protein n=1 Tax=Salinirubrum litoreum TaxID=1126234 RepID=A0ABD5RGP3_9EURY|nr:hypothetical protein [Salinirubrum litoreum]
MIHPHALTVTLAGTPVVETLATLVVVLAVGLALLVAVRAIRGYRRNADPALRALVVGICLVAVVPLSMQVVDVGLVPDTARYAVVAVAQALGLLAILSAMYGPRRGPPRSAGEGGSAPLSPGDPVVAGIAVVAAVLVGWGLATVGGVGVPTLALTASVVGGGVFVAGQAVRAYRRRGDPRMATLAGGILAVVAGPVPTALVVAGSADATVALAAVTVIAVGQALLLVTLSGR